MREFLKMAADEKVMGGSRRREIEHHLPEEEIDEMLREAEDDDCLRRLAL